MTEEYFDLINEIDSENNYIVDEQDYSSLLMFEEYVLGNNNTEMFLTDENPFLSEQLSFTRMFGENSALILSNRL